MADSNGTTKVSPQKQGTMEATAKEGIQYLKDNKMDRLVEAQGLDDKSASNGKAEENGTHKPKTPEKQGTMQATAEEAQAVLESMGGAPNAEARTRKQQAEIEKDEDEAEPDTKKVRVERDGTMQKTAKESEEILGGEKLGGTRSETTDVKDVEDETKPTPRKTKTMEQTVKEAETILSDKKETTGDKEKESAKKAETK